MKTVNFPLFVRWIDFARQSSANSRSSIYSSLYSLVIIESTVNKADSNNYNYGFKYSYL